MVTSHQDQRRQLDMLLLTDAIVSLVLGTAALMSPHGLLQKIGGGEYSHSAHEVLRLYGCLRIAVGWIIYHVRTVDDGRFRRTICEALFFCYMLQSAAVMRAQFTDRRNVVNWIAIVLLTVIGFGYGRFRFSKGGDMIKVYELPQNNKIMR
mmetsp:Transcript_21463/g.46531  ORF Transcript_21463/g.46531 Transcript_21463/m.46531 type:complete len:151 (-) Transcript_21463:777-1229(-)|eukprot:g12131.t1 g12131   contig6:1279317-1279996(-)